MKTGLPQDKLGVMIGIDELTSSARISRYENGTHAPSFEIAERLADVLGVPTAYFYCTDDELAQVVVGFGMLTSDSRRRLLGFLGELMGSEA